MRRRLRGRLVCASLTMGLVVTACCPTPTIDAATALQKYPPVASEAAAAIGDALTPLTTADTQATVDERDDQCILFGHTYVSGDMMSGPDTDPIDPEQIDAALEPVLTRHGFSDLDAVDSDGLAMERLLATDSEGGELWIVLEPRSGHSTITLQWRARLDTEGQPCTDALLD